MGLARLRTGGAAAVATALRRALGVLWLADAVVKILIPFGDRAADQWYEQIMTAETGPRACTTSWPGRRTCSWLTRSCGGCPLPLSCASAHGW